MEANQLKDFWSFFDPYDLTSETLSNLLQNELHPLIGEDPQKLVAQTFKFKSTVLSLVI